MSYWRLFIKQTTIHGLRFITKKRKYGRHYWALIFLASFSLCLWQSVLNIRDYLEYNVQTATTFTTATELEYPAITFWNSHPIRGTIINRRFDMKMIWAQMLGLDFLKVNKTCNYRPKQRDNVDDLVDSMMENVIGVAKSGKVDQKYVDLAMKLIFVNREMTFVKCWWKQQEMDCKNQVLNTFIATKFDYVPSFTVNLASGLNKIFKDKDASGLSFENEDYKQSEQMIFWQDGVGMDNGYKFLLNANVEDYCMTEHDIWYGVGLHAVFHGRQSFPNGKDTKGTVYLKPGFQYNVALKPKLHQRQTEHIGKCVSSYHSYALFPVSVYDVHWCQLQCSLETEWKVCQCSTLANSPPVLSTFANHHRLNASTIESCWSEKKYKCYDGLFEGGDFSNAKYCSHCKQPCQETVFDFDVTAVAFPPKHLAKYYKETLNQTNDEAVGKNYIVLNVFFESKSVNIVLDTQMFTIRELFIYLGNNAILFLGMSFMSFYETFYLVVHIFHLACAQFVTRKKTYLMKGKNPANLRGKKAKKIRSVRSIKVAPKSVVTTAV